MTAVFLKRQPGFGPQRTSEMEAALPPLGTKDTPGFSLRAALSLLPPGGSALGPLQSSRPDWAGRGPGEQTQGSGLRLGGLNSWNVL